MKGIRQAGRLGTLLAVALLAAACSSGSSGPGVAGAGSSAGASASSSASSGQSGSSSQSAAMAKGIAYAQCMRSHGEPKYPDPTPGPNGQGAGWQFGPNSGIDFNSPQYQAATKACGQPPNLGGTTPSPLTAAQQKQYLKWAACIRAHGVPNFKDPTFSNGYPEFTSTGYGAQMQAARQACKQYLNGISGGGTFTG